MTRFKNNLWTHSLKLNHSVQLILGACCKAQVWNSPETKLLGAEKVKRAIFFIKSWTEVITVLKNILHRVLIIQTR